MFSSSRQSGRYRRRPVRRRKAVPQWVAIAGIALAVLIVGMLVYSIFFKSYSVDQSLYKLPVSQDGNYTFGEDTLYYTQGSKLYATNYSGQEKWTANTSASDMEVSASLSQVACYTDSAVQCFDRGGTLRYSKEFLGTIQSVRCGESNIAVYVKEASGLYRLIVLNSAGADSNIDLGGKYVVDYGYYEGDRLYIHSLDGVSVTPSATIETYDRSLASTGKISIQGQLLQSTLFFSDHLFAVGTNHLYKIGYVGDERGNKLIYGWNYAGYIGSSDPTFAFIPGGAFSGSDAITTVRLCTIDGSDTFIQMKSNTAFVYPGQKSLYTIAEDQLYIYNLKGEVTGSHPLPFVPTAVFTPVSRSHMGLIGPEGVYLLKLP